MKQSDDPKFKQLIGFIDLVFNQMMGYAFLFILAFTLVSHIQNKDAKIDPKAEAMIVFTWPDWSPDDLDVWVQLPSGQSVWWQNKNGGLVNLERDDYGLINDITNTPEGPQINPQNREVMVFRGMVPGRYQVNVHYWLKRTVPPQVNELAIKPTIPQPPYPVKVTFVRLNPFYKEIISVDLILEAQGQELSAFGFTITPQGEVVDIDRIERRFVTAPPAPAAGAGLPGYGLGGYTSGESP